MTALCTVQGEERYKAHTRAIYKKHYDAHREEIVLKQRLSWRKRLLGWRHHART
jgi:hypothetical protein